MHQDQQPGSSRVVLRAGARISRDVPPQRSTALFLVRRSWAEGRGKAALSQLGATESRTDKRRHPARMSRAGTWEALRHQWENRAADLRRVGVVVAGVAAAGGYAFERVAEAADATWPTRLREPSEDSKNPAVLIVTPRYLPEMGGIESHVHETTRRLKGRFRLSVVTTDNGGRLPASELLDGIPVLRERARPTGRDWRWAPGVYRQVVASRADLVHCQGVHTFVPVLAMAAARRHGLPYVVTFHTGGHSSGVRSRLRGLQWRALAPLLRSASALICVAEFERDLFAAALGLPKVRLTVIRNGGVLPGRPARPATESDNVIVSVGRFERYKGHHRLVEAMPAVLREIPDTRLVIVGRGPEEDRLRAQARKLGIADRVTFTSLPPSDRAGMASLLGEARVFALLSDYEAHPLAVMEAVVMGRPAVVTTNAGLGELVDRGLARGVPPDASAGQVASALVDELRNPWRSDIPAETWTWDQCAEELVGVYAQVLGAASASTVGGPR